MKSFLILIFGIISCVCFSEPYFDYYEYKPDGKSYKYKGNLSYYAYYTELTGEKLTVLYRKNSKGKLSFKGLWITKDLAQNLPMIVVRYMGKYIVEPQLNSSQSLEKTLAVLKKAVTKALDDSWLNALENNSVSFSDRNLYKREYAGFDMNYYEFFPIEKNDLSNPTEIHDTTVLKVYSDTVLSSHKLILEKDKSLSTLKDHLLKKPDFDKTVAWQKYRYDNLMDVVEKLKAIDYHHANLKISDWPQASAKEWGFALDTPDGFHITSDSVCKYILMLQKTLKKEDLMPSMAWKQNYGNWKATRCNLFAGDFAQQALGLPSYPWGTKDWRAGDIHNELPKIKDFVAISWDKVWEYASIGYPVFITTPKIGPAGHIAIAFPVDVATRNEIKDAATALSKGKVVQAGASNGLKSVGSGFGLNETNFKEKATAYIFLGYLNF